MSLERNGYIQQRIGENNNSSVIKLDNKIIASTIGKSNNFGLYTVNHTLYNNGVFVCKSENIDAQLVNDKFSEINLFTSGTCINVTLEIYNKLLMGLPVVGYKPFSILEVYNIVDDVENAEQIDYEVRDNGLYFSNIDVLWPHKEEVIYNNVIGLDLSSVSSDKLEIVNETIIGYKELPESTVSGVDCPYVLIRNFDYMIDPNVDSYLHLDYRVDDIRNSARNRNSLERKFTVIIEANDRANGELPFVSKTTYAGDGILDVEFTTPGEHVFCVYAIDSRGCSSPRQYLTVYVKDTDLVENILDLSNTEPADMLATYGVYLNDSTPEKAYLNKKALTDMFATIKNDNNNYTGVKLPKGVYYVAYNDNIGVSDDIDDIDLGTQIYYYGKVESCVYAGKNRLLITEMEVVNDVQLIIDDYKKIFRRSSSYGTYLKDSIKYLNDDDVSSKSRYLKTWALASPISTEKIQYGTRAGYRLLSEGTDVTEGEWYFVYNSEKIGPPITFPNNFKIDFNKSTIQAIQTVGVRWSKDYDCLIKLINNEHLTLYNGIIKGIYVGYDFVRACLAQGVSNPNEGLKVYHIYSSKFCTLEKMDISGSLGYDGPISDNGINTPILQDANRALIKNKVVSGYYTDIQGATVENANMYSISDFYVTSTMLSKKYFYFGRGGQMGYLRTGREREFFIHFYDINNNLIKTIKSKLYYYIFIPDGTSYIRLSGYGLPTNMADGDNPAGLCFRAPARCKCITVKNCTMHDTRTTAISPFAATQILIDGCEYTNIAGYISKQKIEHKSEEFSTRADRIEYKKWWGNITALLGDFEDGWELCKYVTIRNCEVKGNNTNRCMNIIYCEYLDFNHNKSMALKTNGGVESASIRDNILPYMTWQFDLRSPHPVLDLNHNVIIGNLTIFYSNNLVQVDSSDMDEPPQEEILGLTDEEAAAINFGDVWNKVCGVLYMTSSVIGERQPYVKLKLRDCINGDKGVDYN